MSEHRKSAKPYFIAAAALIAGLGWVGSRYLHHASCQAQEEEFLSRVAVLKQSAALRAVDPVRLSAAADRMEETEFRAMEPALQRLRTECGQQASQTANQKATQLLLGGG